MVKIAKGYIESLYDALSFCLSTSFRMTTKQERLMKSIGIVVLAGCVMMCGCGQKKAKEAILTGAKESFDWTGSFSLKVVIDVRSVQNDAELTHLRRDYTFFKDGDRTEWAGKITSFDAEGKVGENTFFQRDIVADKRFLSSTSVKGDVPEQATLGSDWKERQLNLLDEPDTCGPLIGRIFGMEHKPIAEVLSEASLSVSSDAEQINDITCYKVAAQTKYGEITAWIAPDRGYNLIKWSLRKKPEDLPAGYQHIQEWVATYEVKELQNVSGVFLPKVATFAFRAKPDANIRTITYDYRIDNIDLHPDFVAINAFRIDLPDGTPVRVEEYPQSQYEWRNGKPVKISDKTIIIEEHP